MTAPDRAPRRRRAVRLALMILGVAALTALAAGLQVSGRKAAIFPPYVINSAVTRKNAICSPTGPGSVT